MRKTIIIILMFAFLSALAGCRGAANEALTGEWKLVRINGVEALPGVEVTLTFDQGTASGFAGCNSFSGAAKLSGKNILFSDLSMTLMACVDEKITRQETDFFIALNQVDTWQVSDDHLKLSGMNVSLEFTRRLAGSAISPTGAWLLVEINGKAPYTGTQFNLTFEPSGSLAGFSGCASYSGGYTTENNVLAFSDLAMTAMTCTDGAIAEAERAYFQALQQVDRYEVQGDNLILSGPGVQLRYTRIQLNP